MRPPTIQPLHVLHTHSEFSVLDGASSVQEYIDYVKAHGLGACGLCDHGFALGLHELISKCNNQGVKPIPGIEFYLAPRPGYVFIGKPYDYGHISLWAYNQTGYSNLMSLASRSWLPDRVVKRWGKPKPRVTWDDIAACNAGLICGSGCIEGPIAKPLLRGEVDEAVHSAAVLNEIFGDRLYFEVMPHAVNRNYHKDKVVTVKDTHGHTFTFLPTDTVETPEGRMTIEEAMTKKVTEIWDPSPNRFQEHIIHAPGSDPERFLDRTNLSDLLSQPHEDEIGDADFPLEPQRRIKNATESINESKSELVDSHGESIRGNRMLINPPNG